MGKTANIGDVALHASVGVSTVSKVLNGYQDIAESTRARVLAAVQELGYRPSRAARTFRTGRTQTVSVFLPRIGGDFYDRLVRSIDEYLADHDYDAGLFPLLSERRLARYKSPDALPYHADGIIFASLNPESLFEDARIPGNLPAVMVDAYHADYDSITVDNAGGAFAATQHLIGHPGDTYIIMIEGYDNPTFSSGVFLERLKGYRRAYQRLGTRLKEDHVVISPFTSSGARRAARRIIDQAGVPVNIFASCDIFARGVFDEVTAMGLQIGGDVKLVGYDDELWAESAELSTVRQPIEQMGRIASELLLRRLSHQDEPVIHRELAPELVVRRSG